MLNFEKTKTVLADMHEKALAYTENFWQKVFDMLQFDDQNFISSTFEFHEESEKKVEDPEELFEMLSFYVFYICNDSIQVMFDRTVPLESLGFQLSKECFLNNHFTQHPKDERRFIRQFSNDN